MAKMCAWPIFSYVHIELYILYVWSRCLYKPLAVPILQFDLKENIHVARKVYTMEMDI